MNTAQVNRDVLFFARPYFNKCIYPNRPVESLMTEIKLDLTNDSTSLSHIIHFT